MRQFPFLRLLMPFVLGIVFFSLVKPIYPSFLNLIAVFSLLFFSILNFEKKIGHYFSVLYRNSILYVAVFFAALFLCSSKQQISTNWIIPENEYQLTGYITETPIAKSKRVKIQLLIDGFKNNQKQWISTRFNLLAFVDKDSVSLNLQPGDKLMFSAIIRPVTNLKNPNEFDNKRYLAGKGIFFQCNIQKKYWITLDQNQGNVLKLYALKLRKQLLEIYKKYHISGNEFAVLAALTLGYTSDIDAETMQAFSASGAMHILSVSGLHVAIVYFIINFLLRFLTKIKHGFLIRSLLVIAFLWFFAFLSGLSPSVQRSALMLTMVESGRLFSRKAHIYNVLALSAFVLLLINPLFLYDVGFQLSYLAVFSIVFFHQKIYWLYQPKSYLADQTWSLISVSIASQLGTFPLGFYYFHQFPNYFLLTNLVVIPLSTIILYSGIALLFLSFFTPVATAIAFLLNYTVKIMNWIIQFIEHLPFSTYHHVYLSWPQMIFLYAVVLFFWHFLVKKQSIFLRTTLLFAAIFLIGFNVRVMQSKTTNKLVVFNVSGSQSVNLISSKRNYLLCDSVTKNNKAGRKFYFDNFWIKSRATEPEILDLSTINQLTVKTDDLWKQNDYFVFEGKRIVIIQTDELYKKQSQEKLDVDFIIMSANSAVTVKTVCDNFNAKLVIFDSSNFLYRKNKWIAECKKYHVPFYSVIDYGAFVYEF